jgi:GNAT superfamily N-acetyltransferase|tara:strand:+ start:30 stop:422 length:393 start_codon:yes stop_codon:yes gene_type:complete
MATLTFVKNEEKYWEFIRNLRNLDGVRQGFIQQEHITEDQQKKYMSKYGECFYICLANEHPAGYVGVIDGDIRVATHPEYQGKGIGSYMLQEMHKLHPNALSKIKAGNLASFNLFSKNGYKIKYFILEKV